jgi:hypothetical protein
MTPLEDLFHRHAAASFDKQLHLGDLLGDLPWRFDLPSGRLSFGNRFHFPTQLVGTEGEGDQTWLWAWANSESGIPESHLQASRKIRQLGEERKIREFTEACIPLARAKGHVLAMIASGVCGAAAYYRGPYEGGALFMLIPEGAFERKIAHPVLRITTVFPQLIMSFELDHRKAFLGYLEFYRMEVEERARQVIAQAPSGERLTADFDGKGRLAGIKTSAGGR